MDKTKITLYEYDDDAGNEINGGKDVEKCIQDLKGKEKTTWIKIDNISKKTSKGIKDDEQEQERQKAFISKLAKDFVKTSDSNGEAEEFESEKYVDIAIKKDFIFLSLNNTNYDSKQQNKDYVTSERVCIIFNEKHLISISEKESEPFNRVTERILEQGITKKKLRMPSYLAYTLLKSIIDNHFMTIDKLGYDIYTLNHNIVSNGNIKSKREQSFENDILSIRQDIITLRSSIFQIKLIFSELLDTESKFLDDKTREYIRHLQSHLFTLMDLVAMARDHVSTSMEVLLTKTSNETNNVMKVLTTLAIIFLPLTFVTGIFGMTFVNDNFLEGLYGGTTKGVMVEGISLEIVIFIIVIISMIIVGAILGIIFSKRNYLKM